MKVTVEDISAVKKKLEIVIPQEKVSGDLDAAYNTLRKTAQIKGFRPGKAPRSILERLYKNQVEHEVASKLISDAYPKAIEEQRLEPVGVPAVEKGQLSSHTDFAFSMTLEVSPHIEPRAYLGMEIEKEELRVTEAMVEERLEQIRSAHAKLQTVEEDRPLKEGDIAVIKYQGYENGKPLNKIVSENFTILLGQNRFNADIERQLVGVKKGEEKSIEVTFPQEFGNPLVAGKTILFEVKVLDIKERVLPDLDDEFARDLGGDFQTLQDLKTKLKEQVTEEESRRIERNLNEQIQQKLIESHEFETPRSLVDLQTRKMMNNLENNLLQQGLNFESVGIVPESMAEKYQVQAEKQVKASLLLRSIAEKESIVVEEPELNEALEKIAKQMGQNTESIKEIYSDNNMMENLRGRLLEEKTLKFIVEGAKIMRVLSESEKIV
jgi:trigger factor